MASLSLINRIKYSKTLFSLYNFIGSNAILLLKFFVKTDDRLIVFASFGGRKYDDSPKAIYEAMLSDHRFDNYQFVWSFMQPNKYELPKGEKLKIDTFSYYKTLLRARVWVTNSSMTRGLYFSGVNTFVLNTWHGSAIKRMGVDINQGNKSFSLKKKRVNNSIMLAQGQYDVAIFSKAFNRPVSGFRVTGLPRNDVLAHVTSEDQLKAKLKLNIPADKKAILYAPTFREYEKDGNSNCVLIPPMDLKKWEAMLAKDYVLLFRAHYEIVKVMGIEDSEFLRNVSSYPDLNELIIASDILISDYSSIFFDYAIQGKPMLCFTYDYERYNRERGMYFDIRDELICRIDNEDDLLEEIVSMDETKRRSISRDFRDKYVEVYGKASQRCLDIIYDVISDSAKL